jgi:hydroxyacylglutathione hydrolase
MKRINKQGWPLLADLVHPRWGKAQDLDDLLAQQALVVDFRPRPAYAHNHRLGTLSIPASSSNFSTYVGWFVDYQRPLYMIVDEGQDVAAIVRDLRAIGVDDTPLYFTPDAWETGQTLPQVSLSELHALPHALIVDVRGQSEYDQIHIPNALNIPLGHLPRHLEGLPQERPIILQCASGYRSQIATTYLLGQGFRNVYNLTAPQSEWAALAL